jgi:hypothetical protein
MSSCRWPMGRGSIQSSVLTVRQRWATAKDRLERREDLGPQASGRWIEVFYNRVRRQQRSRLWFTHRL